jgi:Na+-transporting NADH:ubiquinone oxidoreductase subunit A
MSLNIKLKKGLDIRLEGKAEKIFLPSPDASFFGVRPVDFAGLIPRLNVKEGDKVQAGTPLFHDKLRPEILFVSPVSGSVKTIVRGDRRKVIEVVIEKVGDEYVSFPKGDPSRMSGEEIKQLLLNSGYWPVIRQRPYHKIADPQSSPKSIFISGFDTAPLAPDLNFIMENSSSDHFQTGLTALSKLTSGKVHLILNGKEKPAIAYESATGAEKSLFSGPHPAGNVGVHIHHVDPVNKGEVVWFVNPQDVVSIGRLLQEGIYRNEKIVALTGSEINGPGYMKVRSGIRVSSIVSGRTKNVKTRYISGNVLTGTRIEPDEAIGFYDAQVTLIPEGDEFEFFGWMSPGYDKFSFSRTFLSSIFPKSAYRLNTNFHGGERAFVMTGQYEKVLPMDIFPMQLLKAILAEDIDLMENLGIYEIAEEDFALCEYICPSKIEIQSIIRKGLDIMIREMN